MKHLNTDRLYDSEELAKKALRRGGWKKDKKLFRNVWSRIPKTWPQSKSVEIARICLFEGKYKISVETSGKADLLSWEGNETKPHWYSKGEMK